MHVRTLLTLLLLTAVAFAGCSGGGGGDPEADPTEGLGLEATDTTGVIRGVVVNQAIVPLEGVVVRIASLGMDATTNELGAFGFEGLEPGDYFLEASKPRYNRIQQSATVVAGESDPKIVRIQLAEDPSSRPTYELFQFDGYLECNVVAVIYYFPCRNPMTGEPIGNDQFSAAFDIAGNVSFVHASMLWDPSQPVGTELYMNVGTPKVEIVGYTGGPSPQVVDISDDENGTEDFNDEKVVVFGVSGNGESGGGTVPALVGAEYHQQFSIYLVVFHGFKPPEGYAFYKDGTPVIPDE